MSKKKGIAMEIVALVVIITGAFYLFIWLSATRQAEQSNIKPCEHWVYNYYYRARMNKTVICADSLYINDLGEYKPLSPHLKEMQDEITKEYHFLIKRKALVNRKHLRKPEGAK